MEITETLQKFTGARDAYQKPIEEWENPDEHKYRHSLIFDDEREYNELEAEVRHAESQTGMPLEIVSFKPRLNTSLDGIIPEFVVRIDEQEDRRKIQNRDLNEFCPENQKA